MYYRWKVLPLKRKGNAILILPNFNLGVDHGIVADFFGKTKVKYLRLGGNASESPISIYIATWVKEGKADLIKPPNIQCSHLASFIAIALVSCTEEEPFKAITTCAFCQADSITSERHTIVTISEDESSATDENMLKKTTPDQLIIETSTESYGKGVPGRKNNIGRCEVQYGEHVTFELPKTYTASPKNLLSRLEYNASKWKKAHGLFQIQGIYPK